MLLIGFYIFHSMNTKEEPLIIVGGCRAKIEKKGSGADRKKKRKYPNLQEKKFHCGGKNASTNLCPTPPTMINGLSPYYNFLRLQYSRL